MPFPDCHSRKLVSKRKPRHVCLHPQLHVADQIVTPEICGICAYRLQPPPERFRPIPPPPNPQSRLWRPRSVAVIIPCHNYGRYLEEAVDSVLKQTRRVDEIVIVDDSSTDNTPEVAAALIDDIPRLSQRRPEDGALRGMPSSILDPPSSPSRIRYLRVEHRHSQRARRSGFEATNSDVVCFLDADDYLARDYINKGMQEFVKQNVGIVYSDFELFGAKQGKSRFPAKYRRAALARMNYMHSGSLVLREALDISRGMDIETDDKLALQDWLLWRHVLDYGWTARKQSGLYLYRRHDQSMTADWRAWGTDPAEYFHRAALAAETVTLFIPLSGRKAIWPMTAGFLDRQTWPHKQIRLVLMDTSQNPDFSRTVRHWVADCDYADVRHVTESVGAPGLADRPRRAAANEVCLAMARIYNRMSREAVTDYVRWTPLSRPKNVFSQRDWFLPVSPWRVRAAA